MDEQQRSFVEELIARTGCADADSIDECLLAICDAEMDKEEEDGPQDVQLAFNCVRAVILRCDGDPQPETQHHLAAAVFRRAQFLAQLGRPEEARNDFRDVASSWRGSTDPKIRRTLAANWLEAGQFEEEQGNKRMALRCYEYAMEHADDPDDLTQLQVVRAQSNRGEVHAQLGELDKAVDVYDTAIRRWENHAEYWIRRAVANMRVYKAAALKDEGRHEEALPLFDEALAYADRAVHPPAFFIQASAWLSKAHCLEGLEEYEDAVACVDDFERWMIDHVRPRTDYEKQVNSGAERTLLKAFLVRSRCLNELGRHEEALESFDRSEATLDDIVEDMNARVRACNNQLGRVKILADLGRRDEAMDLINEIHRRIFSFDGPAATPELMVSLAFTLSYVERGPDWTDEILTSPSGDSPDPS